MKMDGGAVMPAPHDSLALWSLISDADLLKVTVTEVFQALLDVLSHYANFYFSRSISVMSGIENNMLL